MAQHSGYPQITNERLDSLYKTYTEADNMAAERNYANEHFNSCSEAAYNNYRRALNEANFHKFTPMPLDEEQAEQETEAINAEVEATGKMTVAQLDRLNELESQAAKSKPKPQFSFVGRGKPQPASPEWAAYERHLHIDYNDTIASFLAGTR